MSKGMLRASWILLIGAIVVVVVAVGLPPFIRSRVNAGLSDMKEGYVGHVERVSIQWLQPGVTLHELTVERPKHKVGAAFLHVLRLEVAILFRSMFEPRIGLRFAEPTVNLVDGPTKAQQQFGPPFTLENLREKLPFDLGYVKVADLDLHYRNFSVNPQINAYLQKVQLTASPADRCIQDPPTGCNMRADIEAVAMAGAGLRARATVRYDDQFELDAQGTLRKLVLSQLNPVLIHHAKIDIQKGAVDLDARVRMRGAAYRCTLLPDFEDLEIMGGDRDKTKASREVMAAMLSGIIERRDERWSIVIDGVKGKDNMRWDLKRRDAPADSKIASP